MHCMAERCQSAQALHRGMMESSKRKPSGVGLYSRWHGGVHAAMHPRHCAGRCKLPLAWPPGHRCLHGRASKHNCQWLRSGRRPLVLVGGWEVHVPAVYRRWVKRDRASTAAGLQAASLCCLTAPFVAALSRQYHLRWAAGGTVGAWAAAVLRRRLARQHLAGTADSRFAGVVLTGSITRQPARRADRSRRARTRRLPLAREPAAVWWRSALSPRSGRSWSGVQVRWGGAAGCQLEFWLPAAAAGLPRPINLRSTPVRAAGTCREPAGPLPRAEPSPSLPTDPKHLAAPASGPSQRMSG